MFGVGGGAGGSTALLPMAARPIGCRIAGGIKVLDLRGGGHLDRGSLRVKRD